MTKEENHKPLGQGMIFLGFILFLVILSYSFKQYLDEKNNPNQDIQTRWDGQTHEVRLKQNHFGQYQASGWINNAPVTFLVDTGATFISIPQSIAEKLQLKAGYPMQSATANGRITVYATMLDSVRLGEIELKNVKATINPHMRINQILLGMNFMKDMEITQKQQQLILKSYPKVP